MKKIFYILILILSLFIINNLVRSIYNLWQKHDLVRDAQEQLRKEKNEHEKLQDQLARVNRPDFVEKEARNKLFMVRPGEKIVLLGEVQKEKREMTKQEEKLPHWQAWWNLFFGH